MSLSSAPQGLQRIAAHQSQPRHRHDAGYAALVLSGGYEESGRCGRVRAQAGDVIFHNAFEGHGDRIGSAGAVILNLRLDAPVDLAFARCRDADAVLRCRDAREAALQLGALCDAVKPAPRDWPDILVADLWCDAGLALSDWADEHGLSAETLSRGVKRLYGVTPVRLRGEIRAHKAWTRIVRGGAPLASIAAETGFADQAHMSRAVALLTGRPPGQWRQ
jgi:AraC-like DNA-binding protein